MGTIDEVLRQNLEYAGHQPYELISHRPARALAVVACMDARLNMEALGLKVGDAHIIRNAGGIVTEDVLRSLIISHHLLGTREFMIVNHTECGLMGFRDEDFHQQLEARYGTETLAPAHFYAFSDLKKNVQRQVQKVRSHPWIPPEVVVRGFIYDVRTHRLEEVPERALPVAV